MTQTTDLHTTALDIKNIRKVESNELTPRQIVEKLDRYIIGQKDAKKAVAIAIRNRIRRRLLPKELQDEIYPKNIIMIGPTGCGKTEIARRLSKLTNAPFVKVEATKYTEVGYVGRDVESMIRDLVNTSLNLVRKEFRKKVEDEAHKNTRERLLDLLMPSSQKDSEGSDDSENPMANLFTRMSEMGSQVQAGLDAEADRIAEEATVEEQDFDEQRRQKARELLGKKLDDGAFEEREVEIESSPPASPMVQVMGAFPGNLEDMDMHIQNMLGDLLPKRNRKRKVSIASARKLIYEEEVEKLLDPEKMQEEAVNRVEELGIVFIDEIDKICGKNARSGSGGPDVSREGVQRDLLPIVEGATVQTRQGPVKTDHILFIAAGAFHTSKPSDLIPELQGRFPIRVELEKLSEEDFRQILTNPENSLTLQLRALMGTEGLDLQFTDDGIEEIAHFAFRVNEETENIGARRLHTIVERIVEDFSFDAPELVKTQKTIVIDQAFVKERLKGIVEDSDLARYIL